jgi:hypothetical protein
MRHGGERLSFLARQLVSQGCGQGRGLTIHLLAAEAANHVEGPRDRREAAASPPLQASAHKHLFTLCTCCRVLVWLGKRHACHHR